MLNGNLALGGNVTVVALRQELYHVVSVTRKNVYQTQNVKILRNQKTNVVVINVLAENFGLARGLLAQPPAKKNCSQREMNNLGIHVGV